MIRPLAWGAVLAAALLPLLSPAANATAEVDVSFTALTTDGAPVSGTATVIDASEPREVQFTGGDVRLKEVPWDGEPILVQVDTQYARRTMLVFNPSDASAQDVVRIERRMPEHHYVVHVEDAATGRPVAGAVVEATSDEEARWFNPQRRNTTDAAGAAEVATIFPDPGVFVLPPPGFAPASAVATDGVVRVVLAALPGYDALLSATMEPAPPSGFLRLRNAATDVASSVALAQASTLRLPNGTYAIEIVAASKPATCEDVGVLRLQPGANELVCRAQWRPATKGIALHLGTPDGIQVEALSANGITASTFVMGGEGRIQLSPGQWVLRGSNHGQFIVPTPLDTNLTDEVTLPVIEGMPLMIHYDGATLVNQPRITVMDLGTGYQVRRSLSPGGPVHVELPAGRCLARVDSEVSLPRLWLQECARNTHFEIPASRPVGDFVACLDAADGPTVEVPDRVAGAGLIAVHPTGAWLDAGDAPGDVALPCQASWVLVEHSEETDRLWSVTPEGSVSQAQELPAGSPLLDLTPAGRYALAGARSAQANEVPGLGAVATVAAMLGVALLASRRR